MAHARQENAPGVASYAATNIYCLPVDLSPPIKTALVRRDAPVSAGAAAVAGAGSGVFLALLGKLPSGTFIGSSIPSISCRRTSNQGGSNRLVPSWSAGSSTANPFGTVAAHSTKIPPGHRQ